MRKILHDFGIQVRLRSIRCCATEEVGTMVEGFEQEYFIKLFRDIPQSQPTVMNAAIKFYDSGETQRDSTVRENKTSCPNKPGF